MERPEIMWMVVFMRSILGLRGVCAGVAYQPFSCCVFVRENAYIETAKGCPVSKPRLRWALAPTFLCMQFSVASAMVQASYTLNSMTLALCSPHTLASIFCFNFSCKVFCCDK